MILLALVCFALSGALAWTAGALTPQPKDARGRYRRRVPWLK